MNEKDLRPPVWVGHVVLETDRLEETEQFMRNIGMRSIVQRSDVAVLELRGGTHLVLIAKEEVVPGAVMFDLMVEDLRATHQHFVDMGLAPTPIETASPEHERFLVRGAGGSYHRLLLKSRFRPARIMTRRTAGSALDHS